MDVADRASIRAHYGASLEFPPAAAADPSNLRTVAEQRRISVRTSVRFLTAIEVEEGTLKQVSVTTGQHTPAPLIA